ncbi:4-alpha-glucanotransferase [Sediminibacterium sp. WSJ-3]|nr:4-alpha-glucanotransferase [Sediminibacterium soli]
MGDHPLLGGNQPEQALPMQYFDEGNWYLAIDVSSIASLDQKIVYNYVLRNADGTFRFDWGTDKYIHPSRVSAEELVCIDAWNHAGYFENSFYTEPFRKVLLKDNHTPVVIASPEKYTHTLHVKTPLLPRGQTLCVLGSCAALRNWDEERPLLMARAAGEDAYELPVDLSGDSFPIAYKYGVYDTVAGKFVGYEDGRNRVLHDSGKAGRQTLAHDGWAALPADTWKGAGIAIPVFSLRTGNSFGIGEFSDIPLLVDWAKKAGLTMIQLLPVNDTTATHTWMDSYPYAAISAFALHPIYLNLDKLAGKTRALQKLEAERKRLNALDKVDYETVAALKWQYIQTAYKASDGTFLQEPEYQQYFSQNQHWLVPYAAFCYLRDQYGTVNFHQWPAYKKYDEQSVSELTDPSSRAFAEIALHYFVQYHLHKQLKEATAYAHAGGLIVKGDIAIGVYRYGADAWQSPELYHMDFQAGAPPDDFAVTGQNWGFPTYDWERMRKDGFAWWKQRFEQMSDYFDAFRIDHILGFFRIWSIPMDAVEGIMGHFVPAIPVHISEFHSRQIWFDHHRYTRPFINDEVLRELFGADSELVKSLFLKYDGFGQYALKPEYDTQRKVEAHFSTLEQDTLHSKVQQGLYQLISNVLLFEAENGEAQQYHFRFGMEHTSSFRQLDPHTQYQLREVYVDYFFRRQDDFWMREAMQKLPALKRVTNMLVCGEDLGMVPACVPDVMKQLGLLSLEIQRMPKNPAEEFFHPANAPYLSVVTPSTHDMSTVRGWWTEDRERTQHFYNQQLGQPGEAPQDCEAWINKAILVQHLYSPAMWSVFQLQDLLGIDESLRRKDPVEERINIPANPRHYWQYRMHICLEQLLAEESFNTALNKMVKDSGR